MMICHRKRKMIIAIQSPTPQADLKAKKYGTKEST
jgi:hypothetical protein